MLGAGIRLGEAIAVNPPVSTEETGDHVLQRLDSDGMNLSNEASARLRGELQAWLETRLRAESERNRTQLLEALVESIQTRVIPRISRLEEEVVVQSAAITESREWSLRTEQSLQKLLGGLDKLILKNPTTE